MSDESDLEEANERVMLKAAKLREDYDALLVQHEGAQATIRVHEFTIRQISTERDVATARALQAERELAGLRFQVSDGNELRDRLRDQLRLAREALEGCPNQVCCEGSHRALDALTSLTPPTPASPPVAESEAGEMCGHCDHPKVVHHFYETNLSLACTIPNCRCIEY